MIKHTPTWGLGFIPVELAAGLPTKEDACRELERLWCRARKNGEA